MTTNQPKHICVCVCTFNRVALLKRLLNELPRQETNEMFTYSLVVADNDRGQSAQQLVLEFDARAPIRAVYCVEPDQNIARARNKALAHATGDYVAFIDDDEFPATNWLLNLFKTCWVHEADGVLGPVKPHFEKPPPKWVTNGGFFERPTHETGYRVRAKEARTGNVLLDRRIFEGMGEPFQPQFRTGGEDVDFFTRMMAQGRVFVWCNEAPVFETVPASRCTRGYLLRRALLRGRNSLKNPSGRAGNILKSMIAAPLYALALPLLLLAGQHVFLKYLIKFTDHAGRLLALVGLNPAREREM
jgi:glycosyltransferase involved in cell wall biosynthesis